MLENSNFYISTPFIAGAEARCYNHLMMETSADRRRRKLRLLTEAHGRQALATAAGMSAVYLDQLVKGVTYRLEDGSTRQRALGDKAARAIEDGLRLGKGWFDSADDDATRPARKLKTPRGLSDRAMEIALLYDAVPPARKARAYALVTQILEFDNDGPPPAERAAATPSPKPMAQPVRNLKKPRAKTPA